MSQAELEVAPVAVERECNARQEVLQRGARAAGRRWAETLRAALRHQGRAIAGGWPGTVSEARAIVERSFRPQPSGRAAAFTFDELAWLTRITYAAARQEWLSGAERDAPDSDS